jgi:hypothetical protein
MPVHCEGNRNARTLKHPAASVLAEPVACNPSITISAGVQLLLSLLLNIMLLGGSMLAWSGGGLLLGGPQQRLLGGSGGSGAPVGWDACERPVLDDAKLSEWGCRVFQKACFDQVRFAGGCQAVAAGGWPLARGSKPSMAGYGGRRKRCCVVGVGQVGQHGTL